jgi:hypothetical protein
MLSTKFANAKLEALAIKTFKIFHCWRGFAQVTNSWLSTSLSS